MKGLPKERAAILAAILEFTFNRNFFSLKMILTDFLTPKT